MSDLPDFVVIARRVLSHRLLRLTVCWLACIALASARWHHAYTMFRSPDPRPDMTAAELDRVREDRNIGHTHIDFGGQWVFARTAYEGHWRELYDRDTLRRTAVAGYPVARQSPAVQKFSAHPERRPADLSVDDVRTDSDRLLRSMMGDEKEDERNAAVAPEVLPEAVAVAFAGGNQPLAAAACRTEAEARTVDTLRRHPVLGGPLYPPVHALLYAPVGAIPNPQRAYYLFQLVSVVALFGCGAAVRVLSRGRVWCSVATLLLMLFPGIRPGLDLGQNHCLTLFVVVWGWALAARGWPFVGGLVWGVLAFKPVWGVAFVLAPIVMRNWRMLAGIAACGFGLVLATLPLVGVEGWKNWLTVGQEAATLYNRDENWINLSRDVSGIPKRILVDFGKPRAERESWEANLIGTLMLAGIAVTTAGVYLFRGDWQKLVRTTRERGFLTAAGEFLRGRVAPLTGHSAGFLLLGCYLCCYRFMYYDAVLASVGFAAMLADPRTTLFGPRGELHTAGQSPARRRAFLFVSSVPLTGLLLLAVFDNWLLNVTPRVTVQADQWGQHMPDGTQEKVQTDGAVATEPKWKWTPKKLSVAVDYNHAWDTLLVMLVWGWAGWRLLRDGRHADCLPPAAVPAQPEQTVGLPAGPHPPPDTPADSGALPGTAGTI